MRRYVLYPILVAQSLIFASDRFSISVAVVLSGIALACTIYSLTSGARSESAWLRDGASPTLVLDPPFAGRWRAVAGGPTPAHNHHMVAPAQRFAYDFVAVEGESLGQPILAPCSGTVVSAVDGMRDRAKSRRPDDISVIGREVGNHVTIDSGHGFVFLCHLQQGSVCVRPGDRVESGDPVGRCGNSGRTTEPHLHLHAQDLPTYSLFKGNGVPIAFRSDGVESVLRFGDELVAPDELL
jgi:murein DD-endopeptidase MepM/ murein hydrolase activator NlpD